MKLQAALLLSFAAAGFAAERPAGPTSSRTEVPDYVREIKPILVEHCYRCHGASQQKGGLRLDTAALAKKGGDTGAGFKVGSANDSLIVQAIKGTHSDIPRMPYKKPALSGEQIAMIERWIASGAHAPDNEAPESARHWAFVPPVRQTPPAQPSRWPRNSIDNFILERLTQQKITPAPEASRPTLIRRLYLDMIGLPPTVAELEAFLRDRRPDAYERLVERLLDSPHYGERWGRTWLDVARYADSNGYSIDAPRSIWKYRDWVIAALNRDLPYDRFVVEQLAGDLLPNPTIDQRIATGFHRNTQINQEGGIDPEQFRVESVLDRVNTTGTAFLGLTIGCAQCHDHKFDPITQREYYQLYAFLNQTVDDGHGKEAPGGMLELLDYRPSQDELAKEREEAEQELDRYLNIKGNDVLQWENKLTPEARAKLKAAVTKALKVPAAERTVQQKRAIYAAFKSDDPEFKSRNAKLTKLEKGSTPLTTLVMMEQKQPRRSYLFTKGDFTRDGGEVAPGVPAVLNPLAVRGDSTNRLDLANWIVAPENPLTARVMVNRVWQQYFGRGLVETENDFGTQGSPPSHPELLDWLATEFMRQGWSLKKLHHLIVTSATYRQSSRARPELQITDPLNKLLARQSRLRLDAEVIRDLALSASGTFADKIGGPPVFPPQPDGVMTLGQVKRAWSPSKGADRYRRGIYTHFWRATPYPALTVFDAPDAFSACTRRLRSNTPLQALTLLNDETSYDFAQHFSKRLMAEGGKSDSERIHLAFSVSLNRPPKASEKKRIERLLSELRAEHSMPEPEVWTTVARVMLNLDETITRE
jgi:hypothetical protein